MSTEYSDWKRKKQQLLVVISVLLILNSVLLIINSVLLILNTSFLEIQGLIHNQMKREYWNLTPNPIKFSPKQNSFLA